MFEIQKMVELQSAVQFHQEELHYTLTRREEAVGEYWDSAWMQRIQAEVDAAKAALDAAKAALDAAKAAFDSHYGSGEAARILQHS